MNEVELIDFCEEHFADYAVCKALKCEELCKDDDCPLVRVFNGYRAALREKAEREKGCGYCEDNFSFWQSEISGSLPNVYYCPMCGRELPKLVGTIGGEIVQHALKELEEVAKKNVRRKHNETD